MLLPLNTSKSWAKALRCPSANSLINKRNPQNFLETLKPKSSKLGSSCSANAAWEGFQFSAAKTGKSPSESSRNDREGRDMEDTQ